ncbi:MAG: MBL fold metallo-hydrolase [Candidatus Auribacterota bacterium]|jgi:phosphoribosyl 1,2-cyclic phosphodiesterase|nr:MBL fold metallo-hydrolase [Candidatus Auribacterota bacterium]
MRLCVLGSSSSGNSTYLELGNSRFLIDAGLSARVIEQRLAMLNVAVADLDAIFITHEHTDHINGLKVLAGRNPVPVYCTRHTALEIESILKITPEFYIFSSGEPFKFDDVVIEPFSVFHDAQDPVGFCFHYNGKKIGFASDLGYVTTFVKRQLQNCDALLIESNHDVNMLIADQKRPWSVKQRIKGRQGHLSNEHACELIAEIAHPGLRHVVLVHLSQDCNRPDMAYKRMAQTLDSLGLDTAKVHLSYPHKPSEQIPLDTCRIELNSTAVCYAGDQLEIPMVL